MRLRKSFLSFCAILFCFTFLSNAYGINCEDAQLLRGKILQVNNGTVKIEVYHLSRGEVRTFKLRKLYNSANLVPGKEIKFLLCGECGNGVIINKNKVIKVILDEDN